MTLGSLNFRFLGCWDCLQGPVTSSPYSDRVDLKFKLTFHLRDCSDTTMGVIQAVSSFLVRAYVRTRTATSVGAGTTEAD
jgi:hypothetical protein